MCAQSAQILYKSGRCSNCGFVADPSKSAQYLPWRSPRRALDQDPGFWADSAGGNPRDNRRPISSFLHHTKKRTGRTASIRRASPPRAVEAPEPQVVVVRPPRARRVEDRVGGVDAGHPFFTSRAAPVRVVFEREPSVRRTDLRLRCRRRHSERRVMRRCARKVDGVLWPRF